MPSTGENCPYVHLFFGLRDGSSIAFFDLGDDTAAQPSPNTPGWAAVEAPVDLGNRRWSDVQRLAQTPTGDHHGDCGGEGDLDERHRVTPVVVDTAS